LAVSVRFAASSDYKVPASIEKAWLGDVAGPFCFEAVFRGLLVQFEPVTEMPRMKITATTAIGALAIFQGE
jgi:hypothetical protein